MHFTASLCFCLFFLLNSCFAEQNSCKDLNIGSALTSQQTLDDIVKNGMTASRWLPNSAAPILASPNKALDYFYVTNLDHKLDISNIRLTFDHTDQANSKVMLKEEKKGSYAVEVTYECRAYGGYIINYQITVDVPDCGSTTFEWKKLCGNPFTERSGFTVEAKMKHDSRLLAKNGRIHSPGLTYDKEVDDYALVVPSSVDTVTLEIYMNENDMKDFNHGASRLNSIPQQLPNGAADSVWINRLLVDADQNILDVHVGGGDLAYRGVSVSKDDRQKVEIQMQCKLSSGRSTVEIDISMPNFKGVDVFFIKECGENSSHGFWILLIIVIAYGVAVYYNDMQGNEPLPFQDKITALYEKAKKIRIPKITESDTKGLVATGDSEEDYELEFRNKNVKNDKKDELDVAQYGTF